MNRRHWIPDEAARMIEAKLREAFGCEAVVEEEKFKLVRDELELYEPDDLHGALPYVLIGFLQFGVADVKDEVHLGYVLMFLNARGYPWDDPSKTPEQQKLYRTMGLEKEQSVSGFSVREAHAIRLWLEAVRDSGIFYLDDNDSENLGYALAYWQAREQGQSVEEPPALLPDENDNDVDIHDTPDGMQVWVDWIPANSGRTILVLANWERPKECHPSFLPLTIPPTADPAFDPGGTILVLANRERPSDSHLD